MGARRLPVAPRPFRDETLSSWLGRIACRYGLDAPALAACLAAPDDPSMRRDRRSTIFRQDWTRLLFGRGHARSIPRACAA
jgi:hypothetical protein